MLIKVTLLVVLLLYALILGESLFCRLAFSRLTRKMEASKALDLQKLIDQEMGSSSISLHFILLAAATDLVAFCVVNPNGLLFRCAVISLAALTSTVVLIILANAPSAGGIKKQALTIPGYAKTLRMKWFAAYRLRWILNLIGFIALLWGTIFGL